MIREYIFTVETKESGQRRKYGDSYYHYIVTSSMSAHVVKEFCTKFLKPSIAKDKYMAENNSSDNHFRDYCTMFTVKQESEFLSNDGKDTIVEYKVVSPSTH